MSKKIQFKHRLIHVEADNAKEFQKKLDEVCDRVGYDIYDVTHSVALAFVWCTYSAIVNCLVPVKDGE